VNFADQQLTSSSDSRHEDSGERYLEVVQLGSVPYADGIELQENLVMQRKAGVIADRLLLLEHPHVITLGVASRNSRRNILVGPSVLEQNGIEVHETHRGGDVTYHGPGQLVGYPIIDLKPNRMDVHRYVRDLEEILIRTAAHFGVIAKRQTGMTGVWVGENKLAAIGVRLSRWVTSHGFALNVTTELDYFGFIRPCGLANRGVTSLAELVGEVVSMSETSAVVSRVFLDVFE